MTSINHFGKPVMRGSQRRAEILQYTPTFQRAWTGNGPHTTPSAGTITWKRVRIACVSWPGVDDWLLTADLATTDRRLRIFSNMMHNWTMGVAGVL
jgi:hypothetical protein